METKETTTQPVETPVDPLITLTEQISKATNIPVADLAKLTEEMKKIVDAKFEAGKAAGIAESKTTFDTFKADTEKQFKEFDLEATKLLKESVDLLETKYTKVLDKLCTLAEKKLRTGGANMVVVEKLSKFIDAYIDEAVGEQPVVDSEKLARLQKFYDNVRESVQFSNDELQTVIAKKTAEIESELKTIKESLNKEIAGKIELVQENNKFKKEEILSSKLAGKRHVIVEKVRSSLKDADLKTVTESINSVIDKVETELDLEHSTEADKTKKPSGEHIVESSTQVEPGVDNVMDVYAQQINRISQLGI